MINGEGKTWGRSIRDRRGCSHAVYPAKAGSADIQNTSENRKLCRLFKMISVAPKKKINIGHAYLISKGAHHAGTWPRLSDAQQRVFAKPILVMYRYIVGEGYDHENSMHSSKTNSDIIHENGFLSPVSIIRRLRTMLFVRITLKAVEHLSSIALSMQHVPKSWANCVLEDLKLLSSFSGVDTLKRGASFTKLEQWQALVLEVGKGFYKCVAEACRHPLCNVVFDNPAQIPSTRPYLCDTCPSTFASHQSLCVHQCKAHGIKNICRRYVGSEIHCVVCMKLFWNRERVVNHVRYRSKICRDWHFQFPPYYTQGQADEFDDAEAKPNRDLHHVGSRRHKASRPCIQLAGPLVPIVVTDGTFSKHHPLGRGHQYFA